MLFILVFIWSTFFSKALLLAKKEGGGVWKILSAILCIFISILSNLFSKAFITVVVETPNDLRGWHWEVQYTLVNIIMAFLKLLVKNIIYTNG